MLHKPVQGESRFWTQSEQQRRSSPLRWAHCATRGGRAGERRPEAFGEVGKKVWYPAPSLGAHLLLKVRGSRVKGRACSVLVNASGKTFKDDPTPPPTEAIQS